MFERKRICQHRPQTVSALPILRRFPEFRKRLQGSGGRENGGGADTGDKRADGADNEDIQTHTRPGHKAWRIPQQGGEDKAHSAAKPDTYPISLIQPASTLTSQNETVSLIKGMKVSDATVGSLQLWASKPLFGVRNQATKPAQKKTFCSGN